MHSAILLTFIKLPFVIKKFVFSLFEWLFYTGFTVFQSYLDSLLDIKLTIFKAAQSVTFDLLFLEIKFLFFKNTVKILKFR